MKALALSFLALICLFSTAPAQTASFRSGDTVTSSTGLRFIIRKHGSGRRAETGKVVIAHYIGTLTDGTVFDDSHKRNEPFGFTLGRGQVIKGWDEGFSLLRVGDQATLIIPPDIAYGENERGPIPANSTLIFNVEFLDMKDHSLVDELTMVDTTKGIDAVVTRYHALKQKGFKGCYVNEGQLNMLGYKMLNSDRASDAIKVFQLNVDAYPESANVYDSLGEAYMNNGDNKLAITNYEKSLELDPKNANATEMLNKLKSTPVDR
jgi:hypothetical protein